MRSIQGTAVTMGSVTPSLLLAAGFARQAAATRQRERAQDEAMIAAVRVDIETRTGEAA